MLLLLTLKMIGTGAAYGTFLADVVLHFVQNGIKINYISPMNEPDSSFGPSPCGQEGMQVSANQCDLLFLISLRR